MSHKTLHGVLHPDGTLTVSNDHLPDHPVSVVVTLLDKDDESLAEIGDYQQTLADYEERLVRGEILWQ